MAGRVHVVGSVNVDVALRVDRLPAPGMTVLAGDPVRSGGGKGANAAVAAARDGADVRLVAAVGDDDGGRRAVAELAADGVDVTHVAMVAHRPTGLATVCVDASGENLIVVAPGANDALSPCHVQAGLGDARRTDVCVVGFEIPDEAAAAASGAAARLVVNPSPVRPLPASLLRARPILVLNGGEAQELGARPGVPAAADALLRAGCAAVVVTLGAEGAAVFEPGGEPTAVPAFPADVVDTTGAGDTFTGVLAAGLARGDALIRAAERAAAAAALSTQALGARTAMPARARIDRRLRDGR